MSNSALNVPNRNEPGATNRHTVGEFFCHPARWCIPVYQRHYAWDATQKGDSTVFLCMTILSNAKKILQGENVAPHYMGVIHVDAIHEKDKLGKRIFCSSVVDGQQRLTTIQLSLLALLANIRELKIDVPDVKRDVELCLIRDGLSTLDPNNFDRQEFYEVLEYSTGQAGKKFTILRKNKLTAAFKHFRSEYEKFIKMRADLEQGVRAIRDSILDNMELVSVNLRDTDDARDVFEHLNRYGKPLSTFDLIRNKVLHVAAKRKIGLDVEIYDSPAWQCLESPYWEKEINRTKVTHIQSYLQNMLIVATQENLVHDRESVVERYVEFQRQHTDSRKEVQHLVKYTDIYRYLEDPGGPNAGQFPDFGLFSHRYKEDRVGRVLYPVMFMISDSKCPTEQKQKMAHIIESLVVRRVLCGMLTAELATFAVNACKKFGGTARNITPNLLRKFFNPSDKSGDSSFISTFPDDKMLESRSKRVKFDGYKVIGKFILCTIEKHLREQGSFETRQADDFMLYHILPQKWAKQEEWTKTIGTYGEEVDDCVHNIGNITLVPNNKKSNKSWTSSKKILKESDMRLNRKIYEKEEWGIREIDERRKNIIAIASKIWPAI